MTSLSDTATSSPAVGNRGTGVLRLLAAAGPGLRAYRAGGGYAGLLQARALGAGWLLDEIRASGLRGRGGAFFPVAAKWDAALAAPGPRSVVVNGAEDEPGSLKDRLLLATRPHLVLEGALLTAAAVQADTVYVYVNETAVEAVAAVGRAVEELHDEGLDRGVRIEPVGAPAVYVAGEDSAAVEFIETGNARPRWKPPYPAGAGIGGRPTVVGNVETMAHIALVATDGAVWFRELGSQACPGTMLVTVPAECRRPGVYEVAVGTPLIDVVEGLGGGPVAGTIRAVQVGGPGAGWVTDLSVPLEPAALVARDSMLGCGALRVLLSDCCAVDAVAGVARFFASESCGQCPPCRMVTQFSDRVLRGLAAGRGVTAAHVDKALELLADVPPTACALARFPAAPLRTARVLFDDDFSVHLDGRDCGRRHPVCDGPAA